MKRFKLILLLSAIVLLTTKSCEKTNDQNTVYWELTLNDAKTSIVNAVDSIEFKFCLLNEAGNPAKVFNEDEIFSFYFSATNNSDKKLYFDPSFAQTNNNDFCKIFNSENQDLGRPYKIQTVLTIGSGAYPFNTGESYIFKQQWIDKRDSVWFWGKATYESTHRGPLGKGNYYTQFKYRFQFSGENSVSTDTLSFKINFKIQ